MNRIYLLILFAFSLISCKSGNEKEINIPGTRIFINIPNDFKVSQGFIGLEKDKNSMIQVYDLIGGNHYKNENSFSKEVFEKNGAKVFEYKEFKLDGFPAKYICMQAQPNQKGMSIIFGDSTFSDMVMAIFPSDDKITEEQIKKALFSIKYDKEFKVDPLASTFFKVGKNDSKFKFAKASANIFLFSKDGIVKDSYEKEPMFTITTFPSDKTLTKEMISESMLNGLAQNGFIKMNEKNVSDKSINGYQAYEKEIYGYMKAEKVLLYQLVLVKENKAIAIQGITYSEFDDNLIEFKKLSKNIKFK